MTEYPEYEEEIQNIIEMLDKKDARGLDKIMYRYKDMGTGMIFIAMYHALKNRMEESHSN